MRSLGVPLVVPRRGAVMPMVTAIGAGVLVLTALLLAILIPQQHHKYRQQQRTHHGHTAWVAPGHAVNVAFLGNSITFFNDLPRFMEALSNGTIRQNSCLHGGLSLLTIVTRGNGMYQKWRQKAARITKNYNNATIYDYGACSFPQLLFGYDDNLSEENENGFYVNDGKNPCFESPQYLQYLSEMHDTFGTPQWDFVVMNDQTTYPAVWKTKRKSILVLKEVYRPMILEAGARPVFVVTHAYDTNSSKLGDIPTFTSHIYYGYKAYADVLQRYFPKEKAPLLAPCGLAFLTIWEENYEFWQKLFFVDNYHPSPHGTYLMGCVLYATLHGRMPDWDIAVPDDDDGISQLWSRARKMQGDNSDAMPFPTSAEAAYLYGIANRVTLQQYVPASLLSADEVAALEKGGSWYSIGGD
jgi:hypothetical protein